LGHLQRGGAPTSYDRILATRFGCAAVRELAAGNFGQIVVLKGGEVSTIPMEVAAGKVKVVPVDSEQIASARNLGISLGDEDIGDIEADAEALMALDNGNGDADDTDVKIDLPETPSDEPLQEVPSERDGG
jgi:ATP-dependent phosphofructokinase / diphosphate-dependent phosphofructokinase